METIRPHFPSLAAGGALALLLTLTLGFAQTTRPTGPATQGPDPQLFGAMAGRPAARDLVFLQAGDAPFTVPQGRFLVITGIGSSFYGSTNVVNPTVRVEIVIDGTTEFLQLPHTQPMYNYVRPLPEGTTVELPVVPISGAGTAILSGYLEDA